MKSLSCVLLVALSLVGLSEQTTFTIPAFGVFPSLSWDASASDETSCTATISKFVTGFESPPANCSSFTHSEADWINFLRGLVPPAGVTYLLGRSFERCLPPENDWTGERLATQTAICNYVNEVSKASTFCDKLYCITDSANVNVGVSTTCSGTAQRTCRSLLPSANTVLKAAVDTAKLPSGAYYDWTKVNVNCADNCRSVAGGDTAAPSTVAATNTFASSATAASSTVAATNTIANSATAGGDTGGNRREDTGGAMGVSLVAFAVISGLSVFLM